MSGKTICSIRNQFGAQVLRIELEWSKGVSEFFKKCLINLEFQNQVKSFRSWSSFFKFAEEEPEVQEI